MGRHWKIEWRGSIDNRALLNDDNVNEWGIGVLCVIVLFLFSWSSGAIEPDG